jgi:hypothetical protein
MALPAHGESRSVVLTSVKRYLGQFAFARAARDRVRRIEPPHKKTRTATEALQAGYRSAEYMLGMDGLTTLLDRHSNEFDLPAGHLTRMVLDGLADDASWRTSLDAFRKAGAVLPASTEWQLAFANLLEHLGDFDHALALRTDIDDRLPANENAFAMGRLRELKGAGQEIHAFYAERLKLNSSNFLLALARRGALSVTKEFEHDALSAIARNVRGDAEQNPADVSLRLALGFIDLAEGNRDHARKNFSVACSLIETATGQRSAAQADPWCIDYAKAYLLDESPTGPSERRIFPPPDRIRIALIAGSLLRSQGAILPALSKYGAVLSRLSVGSVPSSFVKYGGYRIVYAGGRFLGVPENVGMRWLIPRSLRPASGARGSRMFSRVTEPMRSLLSPLLSSIRRRSARGHMPSVAMIRGGSMVRTVLARVRFRFLQKMSAKIGIISGPGLDLVKRQIDQIEQSR